MWIKILEETDTTGWRMGRAFASPIHHAVEKMMRGPELMVRMGFPGGAK
jgi:hypothetical protein